VGPTCDATLPPLYTECIWDGTCTCTHLAPIFFSYLLNFFPVNFSVTLLLFVTLICYANVMKTIIDSWRFEYIKDQSSDWNKLNLGGFVRPEDGSDATKHGKPFTSRVVNLQAYAGAPQFTEGFEVETDNGTVVLGTKEKWDEPATSDEA